LKERVSYSRRIVSAFGFQPTQFDQAIYGGWRHFEPHKDGAAVHPFPMAAHARGAW